MGAGAEGEDTGGKEASPPKATPGEKRGNWQGVLPLDSDGFNDFEVEALGSTMDKGKC